MMIELHLLLASRDSD